jgi:CheY-like chemotaxis protein
MPGEEWRNEIDRGLLNADSVIILFDQAAAESAYVTYEWAFGLGNGKQIIPVLLEDSELHPRIRVLQYLDFKDQKRPWDQLISRIKTLHEKKIKKQQQGGELSLENLFEGIKSLADAMAKQQNRTSNASDVEGATQHILNARNYLSNVEDRPDTILWVDNNPTNNMFEREAIKALGFQFEIALNTDEAMAFLKSNKVAAVISDMSRPEGKQAGYVLLKELRKIDKATPFILYTGSNKLEDKIMAQERGAQGATNSPTELIDLVTIHAQRN